MKLSLFHSACFALSLSGIAAGFLLCDKLSLSAIF